MGVPEGFEGLRFACECVSARRGGYSDPWAGVAKNGLINNGTKEEILNLAAQAPRTISQLAGALGLSAASVHRHVSEMMESELLRESEEWERRHPAERYYEPNFPVLRADDREELEALCREMSERVAELFEKRRGRLERALAKTDLAARGWTFSDLAQYLYARTQRGARELLEGRGILPPPPEHRNGACWVFWAEEPGADEGDRRAPASPPRDTIGRKKLSGARNSRQGG
jgi:DNA-binding transcriptional ArsR family regulator